MRTKHLPAIICAAILPLSAYATSFKYEFTGVTDNSVWDDNTPPELTPLIPIGTGFTGFFTYESDTPPSFQDTSVLQYRGAITAATFSFGVDGSLGVWNFVGGLTSPTSTTSSNFLFLNDLEFNGNPPYDQFNVGSSLGNLPGDPANVYRSWGFNASGFDTSILPAGQTLQDPLPVDSLLGAFHGLNFGYVQYDANGAYVYGSSVGASNLTMRQVDISVPEPGTWSLLGVGLAGIWLATRRRARAAGPALARNP